MRVGVGVPVISVADLAVADGIPQVNKHRFAGEGRGPGWKIALHVDFNPVRAHTLAHKSERIGSGLSRGRCHRGVAVLRVEGDLTACYDVYELNIFVLK